MTLLVRLAASFTAVIAVFALVSGVNLLAVQSFRDGDRQVVRHLEIIDALRQAENRLAAQEAVLDAYIASADAALQKEFLGPAGAAVDGALRQAMELFPANDGGRADLDQVVALVAAWRKAAEIDMLALQRQQGTQEARMAVRRALEPLMVAERQAIDGAREAKEETATTMTTAGWGGMALAILISLLAAGWLTRTVQRPLLGLTAVVDGLSRGEFDRAVPATARHDEIGTIARAIDSFKSTMAEAEQLRVERKVMEATAQAGRQAAMNRMADEFEGSVKDIVHLVAAASTELQSTARSMREIAETTNSHSLSACAASDRAAENSRTVASATNALQRSVGEIRAQIAQSVGFAIKASDEMEQTSRQLGGLEAAAEKIGSIVRLITDITKQTNTLALNATIEAARAGESGRGFAVVAAEVRGLADRIASATSEISAHVADMRGAMSLSVKAILHVGQTIAQINQSAEVVARAIDEQGVATELISENVAQAAASTQTVTESIGNVTSAASDTGVAAGEVLTASADLSRHSEVLREQVNRFLSRVRSEAHSG